MFGVKLRTTSHHHNLKTDNVNLFPVAYCTADLAQTFAAQIRSCGASRSLSLTLMAFLLETWSMFIFPRVHRYIYRGTVRPWPILDMPDVSSVFLTSYKILVVSTSTSQNILIYTFSSCLNTSPPSPSSSLVLQLSLQRATASSRSTDVNTGLWDTSFRYFSLADAHRRLIISSL